MRTFPIFLFAAMLSGCTYPELSIERAQFAGSDLIVEVHTNTVVSYYEGSPKKSDFRYYSMLFSPSGSDGRPIKSRSIARIPWTNQLPSAMSPQRILRVNQSQGISAQVLQQASNKNERSTVLRSWEWPSGSRPPAAASTDGRVLAILSPSFELLNVTILTPFIDPSARAMFEAASELKPDSLCTYSLTHGLNYLAIQVGSTGATPEEVSKLTNGRVHLPTIAASDRRAGYVLVVDRTSRSPLAIPTQFFERKGDEYPFGLEGIDESDEGDLLLLYRHDVKQKHMMEYTIRDRDYKVRFRVAIPEQFEQRGQQVASIPHAGWDARGHRILFYEDSTYFPQLENGCISLLCWDYQAGSMQGFTLDVAGAFRRGARHYVPNAQ